MLITQADRILVSRSILNFSILVDLEIILQEIKVSKLNYFEFLENTNQSYHKHVYLCD